MTSTPPGRDRAPDALRYAGLGIQLAVTIGALAWVGQWLDGRFGTGGILTVVLVLLGFAGMMASLLKELRERSARRPK
ncbi:MAG TPA: AtpZ/AtpI family protein [Gemmatimonadales bacterium]|nr:AtpZ/AtpI family protein [Gemmatimonadales bacterium]